MNEPLTITINGQPITADLDEWRAVQRQIMERIGEDRLAWEQERRAAGQVWYALFWRHHTEYVEECFSREAAEAVMGWDDQANVGIVNPDGSFEPTWMYNQDTLRYFERELAEARL